MKLGIHMHWDEKKSHIWNLLSTNQGHGQSLSVCNKSCPGKNFATVICIVRKLGIHVHCDEVLCFEFIKLKAKGNRLLDFYESLYMHFDGRKCQICSLVFLTI